MPFTEQIAGNSGWIDSHCHLNDVDNLSHNLLHAQQIGIQQFLIPGTEPKQWREIATQYSHNAFLAFGVHPWFIGEFPTQFAELQFMVQQFEPVAIGEIGLDYFDGGQVKPEKRVQIDAFEQQLLFAKQRDLPVIIHAVRSHQDVITMLKRHEVNNGVIHAFVGSYEIASHYIDLGFHLGVGPMIFKSAKTLHAISKMPLGQLVLETDAPFLAMRDTRLYNPLVDLISVADKLATLHNLTLDDVRRQTAANTRKLFKF